MTDESAVVLSVIIPTRNRPEQLDLCLHSLGAQSLPREQFEVIVVDDGGARPVAEVIARHVTALSIRLLEQPGRGPAAARNLGIREAGGRFVVFTDDDCRCAPDWLAAFVRAFESAPECGWGGAVRSAPENGICGDASQLLISYLYQNFYSDTGARLPFFCSNNLAFSRHLLQSIGGFDEAFPLAAGEDRELCDRWISRHPLRYLPEAVVFHRQRIGFPGFLRQHFRYGRGAFHFHTRRAERGHSGLRVEPFRFYSRMLRYPWGSRPVAVACALSALLAISQVANVAGFVLEMFRARGRGPMAAWNHLQ